jgi:hypothetical protein
MYPVPPVTNTEIFCMRSEYAVEGRLDYLPS